MADSSTFGLQVASINGVFYDGRARMIILPCVDGETALLAHHEEMFLAIYDGMIRIQKPNGEWIEAVSGVGAAQIANNRCTVIVDTVELPENIDIRRAQEALEIAKENIRQNKSQLEYKSSQAAMARALSRLKAASKYDI